MPFGGRRLSHEEEPICLKQTINNACSLYAIIHSVCNVPGVIGERLSTSPGIFHVLFTGKGAESIRDGLIKTRDPVKYLEDFEEIERLHIIAALNGGSEAPCAEAEVEYHYICLIRHSRQLYVLDGDMDGPIPNGSLSDNDDLLTDKGLAAIRDYTESNKDGAFGLLALVERQKMLGVSRAKSHHLGQTLI
jgi:ubiquitin carboxyl-terminal hydrolase L3